MATATEGTGTDRGMWLATGTAVVVLLLAALYFLQTRDPTVLIAGSGLIFALIAGTWVFTDARRREMPAWPWLAVVVLTQALGLVAYLVVRELRGQPR